MNDEQIDDFIRNLRTRLINERHNIKEGKGFQTFTNIDVDKIEIHFYRDKPTTIPLVTIVWEDGSVSSEHWKDITSLTNEGLKAVYKYCPIKLSTIKPIELLKEVIEVFQLNHVSTIEE